MKDNLFIKFSPKIIYRRYFEVNEIISGLMGLYQALSQSARKTSQPATKVATTWPRKRQPPNGVLWLFDLNCWASTVHSRIGSNTVTSATAPTASPPPARSKARAGPLVSISTTRLKAIPFV